MYNHIYSSFSYIWENEIPDDMSTAITLLSCPANVLIGAHPGWVHIYFRNEMTLTDTMTITFAVLSYDAVMI